MASRNSLWHFILTTLLWTRVAVVGSSGAGKITVAGAWGRCLGTRVGSLDEHCWLPGWQRPDRRRWRGHQAHLLNGQACWIADDNHWSSLDIRPVAPTPSPCSTGAAGAA